ncbi:hypothetical protein HPB47_012522 [Ixodes persulcatus]|uniref:Uncharacterized protein n=1 Tax=Ixodes persulcatus TaxID=34615 RepID=A0AC60NTC3_IXOPE|nr:hypothetical protein HPB47_012522 [Ixodes persulcatus]
MASPRALGTGRVGGWPASVVVSRGSQAELQLTPGSSTDGLRRQDGLRPARARRCRSHAHTQARRGKLLGSAAHTRRASTTRRASGAHGAAGKRGALAWSARPSIGCVAGCPRSELWRAILRSSRTLRTVGPRPASRVWRTRAAQTVPLEVASVTPLCPRPPRLQGRRRGTVADAGSGGRGAPSSGSFVQCVPRVARSPTSRMLRRPEPALTQYTSAPPTHWKARALSLACVR